MNYGKQGNLWNINAIYPTIIIFDMHRHLAIQCLNVIANESLINKNTISFQKFQCKCKRTKKNDLDSNKDKKDNQM